MTAPAGWVALPTISPQKADFALINETVDFIPGQTIGAMQRNAPGWQRWRLSLQYENLSQDEQAQMKAFLSAVEGGYYSFMVEVGRFSPWRGSLDAFNRIVSDQMAQCNTTGGVEGGTGATMHPTIDQGRIRFDKKGGYNAYDYFPNSDTVAGATRTQSFEIYRPYAARADVCQSPTAVTTANFRHIVSAAPTSYMSRNGNFYSGPSLSYINTRCIAAFIATNTVVCYDMHWDAHGLPGESWWVDNLYIGAVALVDNGQNLCPAAYTMSGWTFNACTLESVPPTGAQTWLDGITAAGKIRVAATSAFHYANFAFGASCKAGSWGMAGNNLQPWLFYSAYTRNGEGSGVYSQARMDIIDTGGGSVIGPFDTTSTGMADVTGTDFEFMHEYFDDVGVGVAQWVRVAIGAMVSSRTNLTVQYLMVNTLGLASFDAVTNSATLFFAQQAVHGNVWRASSYCVPDIFADVPGRWVPTSLTSIVVSGTAQTGRFMYLKGLPSSAYQVARAGDFMTLVNGELKQLTSDLNTDGFGLALAQFQPSVFAPPAHLNPVFFGPGAYGRFRLASQPKWSQKPGYYADLAIDLEEVFEG